MNEKLDQYVKGYEEVESEKIIGEHRDSYSKTDKGDSLNYYTEMYDNSSKSKNSRKKIKKGRTFAAILATALITAIIMTSAFFAASPFMLPLVDELWGIERDQQTIYVYTDKETTRGIIFDENGSEQTKQTQDSTGVESEPARVVIDIRYDDQLITKIAKIASPSVVGIKVSYDFFSYFYGTQTTESQGSGIILTSDGYIITNYHVIQDAVLQSSRNAKIEVFVAGDKDTSYIASIIGYEQAKDLAVIKIDASELVPAQTGNSDELQVGELAVAIGNPAGIGLLGSVTSGIISGLNRQIPIAGAETMNLIQTDAAINPGNSGGALINSRGQVIGINEAKIIATGYEGLGFAIPINSAMESYRRILENRIIDKNITLGVYIDDRYTKEFADSRDLPYGLLVSEVIPTSGAFKAGIKVNDIITKFNGVPVSTLDEFNAEKNKYEAGDIVQVEIYRLSQEGGEYITVDVELMTAFDFE